MPRAKFRCKRCKRSFKMAAHLARHKNTIHAPKRKKAAKAKTPKKAKRSSVKRNVVRTVAASRRSASPNRAFSTGFSGTDGIVNAMRAYQGELNDQRTSLDAQLDAVARAMEGFGAPAPTGRTPRAVRKQGRSVAAIGRTGSLKSYIVRVLGQRSTPLSPQGIGMRVKRAGYKTKAKDLTKAVSNALPEIRTVKRVGRGKYQLTR